MSTAAILSDFNGFEWDGAPFSSEVSSSRYATDAERHGPLSHLGDVQPLHNLNRLCVRDTGALTTPCHPSLTLETDTSQSAFNNILSQFEQDPLLLDPLYQAPAHHLRPISPVPNIPLTHLSSSPSSGELLKKGKGSSRISNNCIGNDDLHVQSGEGMQSKHSIKQLDSTWADMNQAKVLPPVLTAGLLERRDSTMSNEESPLGLEKPAIQVKMRSASHRPKKVSKKPALPAHVVQARECHNNVEKQYRTRLKQKFERLLAVLQASKTKEDSRGKGDLEAPDCGYSRGEVLDFARQRILTLEEENKQLSDQVLNLDRGFTIV